MTSSNQDADLTPGEFSDEQRSAIFARANELAGRPRSQRNGRVRLPPRYVLWVIAIFLLLGVGGQLASHFLGVIGGNSQVPKGQTIPPSPTRSSNPSSTQSLDSFIGLKLMSTITAPSFTLRTPTNKKWSLAAQKGKVVVLTFYGSNCQDICPVLGAEIRDADQQLGAAASKVSFVIVNTNPQSIAVVALPRALSASGLSGLPTVTFLTGSLQRLDKVWSSYGIYISVGAKPGQVSHNNLIYFIGPNGDLAALAEPFARVNKNGVFSLAATEIHRYAKGIASTAVSLVK